MKLRKQIDNKYKWDIGLFDNANDIEKVFDDIKYLTDTLPKYNGKFHDKEILIEYLTKYKTISNNIQKLGFYIMNSLNVDNADVDILRLNERYSMAMSKLNKATSFISPQIDDLDTDYLLEVMADPRCKDTDNYLRDIIKFKPHKIDEHTSKVLSILDNSFSDSESIYDIFTNSEMTFDDAVDSNGKIHKVDNASYSSLVSSKDRKLRESAFISTMNGYGKYNKTFAELYIKELKSNKDFVELRNYESVLDCKLKNEDIPTSVFDTNIKIVSKYTKVLQDYIKILARDTGINDFAYYDLFIDKKIGGKITIDKAHEIMLSALSPLGEDYINLVKKKLTDKSIDYMPNQNKNSGGYCANTYDAKTLILMNWKDDFNSLSTLCHEMGHCINAEYFNMTQPMEKAGITIFAAEIASTVNELLLNQYMQSISTPKAKKYYIKEFLNNVRSTIFRQTLFAEFEHFAHTSIANDIPLTYTDLNNKYYELNKKYYGSSCKLPKNLQYEWSRIPHFYSPYYVYAYSTGLITAINIVSRINDKEFVNNYINFLKNGVNKPSIEVLQEIGIDLTTDEPYEIAFEYIKKQLDNYKSLCK